MTGLFKKMAATVAETVAPLILTKLEQLQITWKKIDEEFMQMVQSSDDVLGAFLFLLRASKRLQLQKFKKF